MSEQTVTINVPFTAHLETDSNGYSYIDHPNMRGSLYAPAAKAKTKLKALAIADVEEALKTVKNYQGYAVGVANGSVHIIHYRFGCWCYHTVGPDRKYAGSCSGAKSFEECREDARRHAEQQGGIIWESSI